MVVSYAAHDPIIRRAALVMTHGGHGTAMRSLRHGVPMVVIPGLAGDQPFVAAAVQEWGAGLALAQDADANAMWQAAKDVLASPSYRSSAQRCAAALAGIDGAGNAADEIESLMIPKAARRRA
jgi:UDP:flavonoid glycosyltransferase YjiC (YdhE family)